MSLDLFGSSIAAADQNVVANAAPDLPAGFGEAFDVAWRSGTEFHNSAAYSIAQSNALSEYRDTIRQKTGESLPTLGMHSEANELNDYVSLDDFNAAQAKLKEKYPGLDYLTPLSDGDLNAMTLSRMKRAHDGAAAFAGRETTWGGTAGGVLGSLAGGLTDPVMVATLPLGGAGEAGIALRALEFAAISGGTEAASAAINYGSREAAVPGSSKEIPGEVAAATVFGGVLGAGFGGLAKLLGHGAKPLPTSVRDEVNAATSEFQFHATNPFPTAAGEAAARDATVEATTALVKGETVRAADSFDAAHVADYALAAKAQTPEELAIVGERHLRPETFGEAPDVERFDRVPTETEDAASYWDRRISQASHDERAALGATDREPSPSFETTVEVNGSSQTKGSYVAYHGTHAVFDHFSPEFQGTGVGAPFTEGKGHFFATDPVMASGYAEGTAGAGNVMRVRVTLNDLERIAFDQHKISDLATADEEISTLIDAARAKGRDGLVLKDVAGQAGNDVIVAFDHQSIKGEPFGSSIDIHARDVTPEQLQQLAADPATESAVLHNLEHIMLEKPDMEFSTQVRQADGSYQLTTQKLSDVLAELDGMETAAKELEACAVGLAAAAE